MCLYVVCVNCPNSSEFKYIYICARYGIVYGWARFAVWVAAQSQYAGENHIRIVNMVFDIFINKIHTTALMLCAHIHTRTTINRTTSQINYRRYCQESATCVPIMHKHYTIRITIITTGQPIYVHIFLRPKFTSSSPPRPGFGLR